MVAPVVGAAVFGMSGVAKAIAGLYQVAGDINDFLNKHIEEMKNSENTTVSRTGRVLEMAKYGFGLGYITPVIVIAAGQLLLGNTFSAIATVATAATLSNPIAMTCAAVGAIYYGWGALSDQERNEILETLSKGLEIGIELVKSVIRFVTDKIKELLSSKNIEEFKTFIGSAASVFGRTLSDVTRKFTDVVGESLDAVKKKSGEVADKTIDVASDAFRSVSNTAGKAADGIGEVADKSFEVASDAYRSVSNAAVKAAGGIREKMGRDSSKD